jgi:hypothetical protein
MAIGKYNVNDDLNTRLIVTALAYVYIFINASIG